MHIADGEGSQNFYVGLLSVRHRVDEFLPKLFLPEE
jgi:hypothetical protein